VHLKAIERVSIKRHIDKGETIFFDGDGNNVFYLVAKALIRIYRVLLKGQERILHIVKAGETIGAVPVFPGTYSGKI